MRAFQATAPADELERSQESRGNCGHVTRFPSANEWDAMAGGKDSLTLSQTAT